MKASIFIVILKKNLIFSSRWFFSLKNWRWICWCFFSIIKIIFRWNNWYCLFFRCGYSTTKHAMCYPFVPIIIVSIRILLNSFIIMILLMVVLYPRMRLIIREIFSLNFFLSWSGFFPVMGCIWNHYILYNRWPMTTYCWPGTNNLNVIIF